MKLPTLFKQLISAYVRKIRKYKPHPTSVLFALTYRCQCKCSHCGVVLYKKPNRKELARSEVMKLIEEIKRLGTIWVCFFGGEPLIVPELIEYIKYAKKIGLKVRLDTNGILLNENMVKKLKVSGLDLIGISIDSPFKSMHDKLRGVQGIFEKAISGIKYCKKYRLESYLGTYATKRNLKNGELKKIIDLGKHMRIKVRILSSVLCGKLLNCNKLSLSKKEIGLLKNLLEKDKVYWEIFDILDSKEIPFFCMAMNKTLFYISPYGEIQPCSYIPISFGNTRKEPLGKIIKKMWSSDIFLTNRFDTYHDCPFNNPVFLKSYKAIFKAKRISPIRYSYTTKKPMHFKIN